MLVDIYHVRYKERDRSMLIFSEPAAVSHLLIVDYESMESWEPPHQHETLDDSDKARIIANMRRALASRQYEMEVMGGPREPFAHAHRPTSEGKAPRDIRQR